MEKSKAKKITVTLNLNPSKQQERCLTKLALAYAETWNWAVGSWEEQRWPSSTTGEEAWKNAEAMKPQLVSQLPELSGYSTKVLLGALRDFSRQLRAYRFKASLRPAAIQENTWLPRFWFSGGVTTFPTMIEVKLRKLACMRIYASGCSEDPVSPKWTEFSKGLDGTWSAKLCFTVKSDEE